MVTWRQRLVRLACAAFIVLASIVGPFVVIGLWPGLNFEVVLIKPSASRFGLGINRGSEAGGSEFLQVRCIVVAVHWGREKNPIGLRRGWRTEAHPTPSGIVKRTGWIGDRQALFLWWVER
jgi:hypothetical protein